MRRMLAGVLGVGLLLGSGGVITAANDPVSGYLSDCQTSGTRCLNRVTDVIENGRSSHYICVPKDLSTADAVQQEIKWLLQTAQDRPAFADTSMEDALWDGATRLWPCRRG